MYKLTKDDVAALKQATSISFHGTYVRTERGVQFERSNIVACKRVKRVGPFENSSSADELRRVIPCVSILHVAYGRATGGDCVASRMFLNNDDSLWHSLRTIRAGDMLEIEWCADGASNHYMEAAALHGDFVRLHVLRYVKGSERLARIVHDVETSCTPTNSARMIQGIEYAESKHYSNREPQYAIA